MLQAHVFSPLVLSDVPEASPQRLLLVVDIRLSSRRSRVLGYRNVADIGLRGIFRTACRAPVTSTDEHILKDFWLGFLQGQAVLGTGVLKRLYYPRSRDLISGQLGRNSWDAIGFSALSNTL